MLRNACRLLHMVNLWFLNEVLSLNAQESFQGAGRNNGVVFLNEVLSLNAQELCVAAQYISVLFVLNEVLSLNAQEWRRDQRGGRICSIPSSMKS